MKTLAKSLLRSIGFEVRRIPQPAMHDRKQGLAYYKTAIGNYHLPVDAPDDAIVAAMKRGKVFEPEVVETANRFIRPGTAVLDLGSNFGQMAMLFAKSVGPNGRVYAFEAQKRVYDILCKNLASNSIANVEATFGAVYHESGHTFHFPEPDFTRFAALGSYNLPIEATIGPEVRSLKVDDLAFDRPISFMKVDVQGCDLFAMQGAIETIHKHRMPILFEFEQRFQSEYKTTFQDYVDFVAAIDYRFVETVMDINYLVVPYADLNKYRDI